MRSAAPAAEGDMPRAHAQCHVTKGIGYAHPHAPPTHADMRDIAQGLVLEGTAVVILEERIDGAGYSSHSPCIELR
jgi:hypothetical protein